MSELTPFHYSLPEHLAFLEVIPLAIAIYERTGLMVACNQAAVEVWGLPREQVIGRFNVLTDPQSVKNRSHEVFERALNGETFEREFDTYYEHATGQGRSLWIRPTYFPIYDQQQQITHVGVIYRDVSAMIRQQDEIQQARDAIASQQQLISDLSSPVVQIWPGVALLPLIGTIDSRRASTITETLLEAISRYQAEWVIIDITGVPIVDTAVASLLMSTVQAAGLLGSESILVGVRPEIAQTIVHLGVDLSRLTTRADLQEGLRYVFDRSGLVVVERTRGTLRAV